jgi:hypothetical protein
VAISVEPNTDAVRIAGYAIWARMSVSLWLVWLECLNPPSQIIFIDLVYAKTPPFLATKDLSVRIRIDESCKLEELESGRQKNEQEA